MMGIVAESVDAAVFMTVVGENRGDGAPVVIDNVDGVTTVGQ